LRIFEHTSVVNDTGHKVRVDVGGGSSVLNVAFTIGSGSGGWNTEGSSSVADAVGEGVHAGGLVDSGETLVVVVSVKFDMVIMLSGKLLHHFVDVFHALGALAHGLG